MMKKTTLALAISAAAMAATPAFATNGDNLIGLGAKSRALGGTGIAAFYGSENALTNPALLVKAKGHELSFGGTLFKPTVKTGYPAMNYEHTSGADTNVIPEVSIVNGDDGSFAWGIGMFGSAGMGVDHKDSNYLMNAQDTLQLMKFVPSVAFKVGDNIGVGVAPVLQYGALDINYRMNADDSTDRSTEKVVGSGMDQDLGWGFKLGAYLDMTQNLTLGLSYDSPISMTYKGQISTASQTFADYGLITSAFSDKLEQPAVLGAGIAYNMGNILMTADFKQIKWGDAKGYKDFGWEDQNVIALGAKYNAGTYWVGVGFNKGDNPVKKLDDPASYADNVKNMFNYLFFPATIETHWTLGGGYRFSQNVSLDAAVVYAPEVSDTVKALGFANANDGNPANNTPEDVNLKTKHSQVGYTVSLRYDF